VVRVQSLYGRHGDHFIRKILRRLEASSDNLRVVNDQVTAPTYTRHVARALMYLAESGRRGVVHVAASGSCSWYEFALAAAGALGMAERVSPVPSTAFPTPARRPARALLDTSRYQAWTGQTMPSWEEGLRQYLEEEKIT
jgi:dTDP-4-dehydrorhamnose reductase